MRGRPLKGRAGKQRDHGGVCLGYHRVSMALRVQARAARQDNNKAAGKAPTGRSAQEAMT
ncbi:hypothetical protein CF138_08130 [Aeromonas hydrophila]|nr:hypothetical protein CF141_19250 [Aeromonas hydrophila]TNH87438.1 hypothetical protein CF138_08130 [Aeromonas hydrophila]TNH93406.1 hypothetical protein CF136_22245 [Aeromonas hydrophila]TNI93188.1 hypothetical protein CF118_17480 [Aeromonas hydrophila]